jgi:uncharacterized protein YigE (DUF2233 family)
MQRRVAILVFFLAGAAAQAEVKVGKWEPLFRGVEFAAGSADTDEPRVQQVRAIRVDLRAPGIELFSSPSNGDAPLETTSETTTEFLQRHKLQVAVNANFYAPCCSPGDKDLQGLAMAKGEVVSPPVASGLGHPALVVTRDHRAKVVATAADFATKDYWTAVAGSAIVLAGGKRPEFPQTTFNTTAHPRTAVGISQDGRYLILLVIDGRQPAWSDGAPIEEVADWLLRFGAHDGLNLDGGGSTALVRAAGDKAVALNRPSGVAPGSAENGGKAARERVQRSNGNNFGVWAQPLVAPPAPSGK